MEPMSDPSYPLMHELSVATAMAQYNLNMFLLHSLGFCWKVAMARAALLIPRMWASSG